FDLLKFKVIWIINYTLFFVSILAFFNFKKLKNKLLAYVNLSLILLTVLMFVTYGLYSMSVLRESYIHQSEVEYFSRGSYHIWIRYISFMFVVVSIYAAFQYTKQVFMPKKFKIGFDFLLHASILWILSSEIIHLLDLSGSAGT